MPSDIALSAFRSQEAAVRGAHECHAMSLRASPKPFMPAGVEALGLFRTGCGKSRSR